ncbi:hypothetical protein EJ08DRAFT_662071 [Tothia fuscella]|uniref:Uncharacterized protein n=1 Tax=Tothia fuscella TaxID=1048955 RepID=A0A9P4NPV3_9PEZI|nr:hypothetical protein EJ08DRAFT_662071 [Tothia fuscella]
MITNSPKEIMPSTIRVVSTPPQSPRSSLSGLPAISTPPSKKSPSRLPVRNATFGTLSMTPKTRFQAVPRAVSSVTTGSPTKRKQIGSLSGLAIDGSPPPAKPWMRPGLPVFQLTPNTKAMKMASKEIPSTEGGSKHVRGSPVKKSGISLHEIVKSSRSKRPYSTTIVPPTSLNIVPEVERVTHFSPVKKTTAPVQTKNNVLERETVSVPVIQLNGEAAEDTALFAHRPLSKLTPYRKDTDAPPCTPKTPRTTKIEVFNDSNTDKSVTDEDEYDKTLKEATNRLKSINEMQKMQ